MVLSRNDFSRLKREVAGSEDTQGGRGLSRQSTALACRLWTLQTAWGKGEGLSKKASGGAGLQKPRQGLRGLSHIQGHQDYYWDQAREAQREGGRGKGFPICSRFVLISAGL